MGSGLTSLLHQGFVELLASEPELLRAAVEDWLGIPLPFSMEHAVTASSDLTALVPAQLTADLVLHVLDPRQPGKVVAAFIFEAQLSRDPKKRLSWPQYVANLRARLRGSPVYLVVLAPRRSVARWCARPFELTTGVAFAPIVVGPDQIPKVTDVEIAEKFPALAALSCMTHGGDADAAALVRTYVRGTRNLGEPWTTTRLQVILGSLSTAAMSALEKLMSIEPGFESSPFARWFTRKGKVEGRAEGKAEGRAEGKAEGILAVLETRSLPISESVRARVLACTDLPTLDRWLRRAVTAEDAAAVFEGG